MAEAVYVLCFLTSAAVGFLLLRGYARTRARLLLWCGLGFVGVCLNNLFLIIDLVVFPSEDFSMWRNFTALGGVILILYGLIWESD